MRVIQSLKESSAYWQEFG